MPAEIFAPSEQEVLRQHAQRFEWEAVEGAKRYVLTLATSPRRVELPWTADIFVETSAEDNLVATGLPLDGNPLYVRLWSQIGSRWYHSDSVFASEFVQTEPNPEQECLERNWQKHEFEVGGVNRSLFLTTPEDGNWQRGALLLLHGGGGNASDWCADKLSTRKLFDFSQSAREAGFAVVALDSGQFEDQNGQDCGQRFDALSPSEDNADLEYLRVVLKSGLEQLRPTGGSEAVFMAGISNGGIMTLRTATEMPEMVDAFAAIAAGDPHKLKLDCTPVLGQPTRPGFYLDTDTYLSTHRPDACSSGNLSPAQGRKAKKDFALPSFLLLHHQQDGAVDISCMYKARSMLKSSGFQEAGVFVIEDDTVDRGWKPHFWQSEYDKVLLDYFIQESGG